MNDKSLRKLSTREKIQLAELTRTREKIVNELSKFPSSQVSLSNDFSRFCNQKPNKKTSQNIYQILSKTDNHRQNNGNGRKSRQSPSSNITQHLQFSRSSEYTDHLRTSLDMIPILASSGEVAMEVDVHNKKGKMKLPIFKLPSIEPRLLTQEKNRRALDESVGSSGSIKNIQTFVAYSDKKTFRRAISIILRSLAARELAYIKQYLSVSDADLNSITTELDKIDGKKINSTDLDVLPSGADRKRSLRAVFVLTEFFSREPSVPLCSTFMRAKEFMHQQRYLAESRGGGDNNSQSALRAFAGGGGLSEGSLSVLGLSAAFQQFIGLSGDDRKPSVEPGEFSGGATTHKGDSAGVGSAFRKIHSLPAMRASGRVYTPSQTIEQRRSRTAADMSGTHFEANDQFQVSGSHDVEPPSRGGMRTSTLDLHSTLGDSRQRRGGTGGRGVSNPSRLRNAQAATAGSGNHKSSSKTDGTVALTRALIESLRVMDKHSKMIKRGIETAQELISIQDEPKARALVFTVAAERMQPALFRIVRLELRRGFFAWLQMVQQARRLESVGLIFRFLVVRNEVVGVNQLLRKVLKYNIDLWRDHAARETQRLQREKLLKAVITIQKVMRRRLATKTCAALKQRKKYQKLFDSTVRIQALMRGTGVKWRYLRTRVDRSQRQASTVIQTAMRAYLACKHVHMVRLRKNKATAAANIQRIVRGRSDRKRVVALRLLRKMNFGAIQIQKIIRGFVSRRTISTILVNRARFKYAVRIQSLIRGALTRMNRERKVAELQEYKYNRSRSVTKIQAAYRGYRSRLLFRMKLFKLRKVRIEQAKAATAIITIVRGFLCRAYLRDLRKLRREKWIADARGWQEMWSDESAAWFYLNIATGDALWEPSSDGYVKYDGTLVLSSGEIIDDPRNKKADEMEELPDKAAEKKAVNKLCSECVDRLAIRSCNECGDRFCTKCYKVTHATGSRRTHTFVNIGPMDCTECELLLAERWCVSCDEGYCDGCWRKVHSHGKRRFHPYSEVSPAGRVDSRIYTMDGEQLQDYDSSYSQQQLELANGQVAVEGDEQQQQLEAYGETDEEWSEAVDDQGYPYWYNNFSGQSQYESPH